LEAAVAAASELQRLSRRALFLVFGLPLAVVCLIAPARAQQRPPEAIELFRSDISVAPDASVAVRETIRVRSAGVEIRHGIFRDFPTRYRDRFGNRVVIGFRLLDVERDDQPEPYQLESIANGVRIRIGRADFNVPPGEHTYVLSYQTTRELGFFSDHDELYWNVTGNGWAFVIERAEARVQLPAVISRDAIRVEGYTGPQGAKNQDYRAQIASDGAAEFTTTRPLARHEGLTIVVGFPKGAASEPTTADRLQFFFEDNRTALVAFAGLAALLIYYLLVWSSAGRDPTPGPIVVRYEPPQGLSPAGMRYLLRMGFDQTTFAAAALSLAVKRYLTLTKDGAGYTLTRNPGKNPDLSPEERALAQRLFETSQHVDLLPAYYKTVQAAIKATRETLRAAEEKTYFLTNSRYLLPGTVISALALMTAMLTLQGQQLFASVFMSIWLTFWSVGVFALTVMAVSGWRRYSADGSVTTMFGAIVVTLFSLPFWAGEVAGVGTLLKGGSVWFAILLAASIGTNILFHYLMKAPTLAGRALLDEVQGFRQYFLAVERDPMQRVFEPDLTTARFETLLPYAVALGVEKAWTAHFAAALAQAGKAPADYSPDWCSGAALGALGTAGFASALGSSLTSAISSASSAPGSSSGGGGGGSSGGGGGGGGGGGW
jgi:uncharacterized membrane protein YgcG